MRVGQENVAADRRAVRVLHQRAPELADSGARIEHDEPSIGRAELQTRRIAAVAHRVAPRAGNRSTRAPEMHAEAHDKLLWVATTQTRTPGRAAKRVRSRPPCDGHHKGRITAAGSPARSGMRACRQPSTVTDRDAPAMNADQSCVLELAHGARDGLAAGADHLRDD